MRAFEFLSSHHLAAGRVGQFKPDFGFWGLFLIPRPEPVFLAENFPQTAIIELETKRPEPRARVFCFLGRAFPLWALRDDETQL